MLLMLVLKSLSFATQVLLFAFADLPVFLFNVQLVAFLASWWYTSHSRRGLPGQHLYVPALPQEAHPCASKRSRIKRGRGVVDFAASAPPRPPPPLESLDVRCSPALLTLEGKLTRTDGPSHSFWSIQKFFHDSSNILPFRLAILQELPLLIEDSRDYSRLFDLFDWAPRKVLNHILSAYVCPIWMV